VELIRDFAKGVAMLPHEAEDQKTPLWCTYHSKNLVLSRPSLIYGARVRLL
jgi:hypothetical protein